MSDATLDLPKVRPPILSEETAKRLDAFLAFRHRFRNLYLFDLATDLVEPLLAEAPSVWRAASMDLVEFAKSLGGRSGGMSMHRIADSKSRGSRF